MTSSAAAAVAAAAAARDESRFLTVPHLKAAGIGETDDGRLFYQRDSVSKLLQFLDDATGRYGFIDGLPGTGKSSTIWYKILCLVTEKKATVTWMHFNRWGLIEKHVKLHYGQSGLVIKELKRFLPTALGDKIMEVDTGILVLDGVNQPMFVDTIAAAQLWKDKDEAKTVYLSMSNKIERLHPHEEKAFGEGKRMYCTQHSWTLDEFKEAFIDKDGRRSRLFIENVGIFEKEWEIEEDDPLQELERRESRKRDRTGRKKFASVLEIVCQKYFVCGGSARWMLQFTRAEIEDIIASHLNTAESQSAILSFDLGPRSSVAKTHMFFSAEYLGAGGAAVTVYTIVSERATQLLVEKRGPDAVQMLYTQARAIQNPSFYGWVVEADYFSRCRHNNLSLLKKGDPEPTKFECQMGSVVEFDCAHFKLLQSYGDSKILRDAVGDLIPTVAGEASSKIGKPLAWNQGGYEVVRVEMGVDGTLHLRFGQITKSATHSLKLQYFREFTSFLSDANYAVASIEIGFIVPTAELDKFRITHAQVTGAGLLNTVPVYPGVDATTWQQSKEQDQTVVYGLDMKNAL